MKKLFPAVLVFVFILAGFANAQTLNGIVSDAQTAEPLPFVNIGILHRNIGTVTDQNGKFSLNPASALPSDSVKISMLGYRPLAFRVADLRTYLAAHNGQVKLEPQVHQLKDVVIKPRKTKTLIAGNTTNSRTMSLGFTSNDLGSEIGTVLKYNKKQPGKLENVNFNLAQNRFDQVLFRVNVYEMKNGEPGENLLTEPLYLTAEVDAGTLTIDLSNKNIYITDDCLLTLEWIEDLGKKGLFFSTGILNGTTYARKTSHGDWFKIKAGIGFWATVVHEK